MTFVRTSRWPSTRPQKGEDESLPDSDGAVSMPAREPPRSSRGVAGVTATPVAQLNDLAGGGNALVAPYTFATQLAPLRMPPLATPARKFDHLECPR